MKFIDEVTVTIGSGHGGPGCVSFRRESHVPRGGPDGGDGGKGGDVIVNASSRHHSLLEYTQKNSYRAENGHPGDTKQCTGADGEDLVLMVPPGTVISDIETGAVLADLGEESEVVLFEGGKGGKGNMFYRNSIQQTPGIAQKGLPGVVKKVKMELKLIADIGLIGFPNAGKSTLISVISNARPKIANYPFTTLTPQLGVVKYGDDQSLVVADIPGLIEGAHKGVGLGIQFLKHIQRTKAFVHLIDVSGFSGRDPLDDYKKINDELKFYDETYKDNKDYTPLQSREQIVVLNKIDAIDERALDTVIQQFEADDIKVHTISAATHQNIKPLITEMGKKVFGNDK